MPNIHVPQCRCEETRLFGGSISKPVQSLYAHHSCWYVKQRDALVTDAYKAAEAEAEAKFKKVQASDEAKQAYTEHAFTRIMNERMAEVLRAAGHPFYQ